MEWRNGVSYPAAKGLNPQHNIREGYVTHRPPIPHVPYLFLYIRRAKGKTKYSPYTLSFALVHVRTYAQDQLYLST